ncbi:MAG: hypothetical protein ACLUSV_10235 [Streptococcus sp.]
MVLVLLAYLSWSWHAKKLASDFSRVQAVQLISPYIWYIWQGFPLDDSLPFIIALGHALALLLLKDSKVKTYFALMGLLRLLCIIHPIFDPYDFPHISIFLYHWSLCPTGQ